MSLGSVTIASVFSATLAIGATVAWSQELPSPPVQPSYSGSDLFKTYCVSCHGASAHGDGPLAAYMKKPPPDLTQFAARNGGVFPSALVASIIDVAGTGHRRSDHRWAAAGKGAWRPRHARLGRRVQSVACGIF